MKTLAFLSVQFSASKIQWDRRFQNVVRFLTGLYKSAMIHAKSDSGTYHGPQVGMVEDVAVVVHGKGVAVHAQLKIISSRDRLIQKICRTVYNKPLGSDSWSMCVESIQTQTHTVYLFVYTRVGRFSTFWQTLICSQFYYRLSEV